MLEPVEMPGGAGAGGDATDAVGVPTTEAVPIDGHRAESWLRQLRDQAVAIDEAIYEAVAATATPGLDRSISRLSDAANFSMVWFGVGGVLATIGGRKGRAAATDGVAAIGLASLVANQGLKRMARRGRPARHTGAAAGVVERHVRMPTSTSFPSGHSASAFAFAAAASGRIGWLSPPLHLLAAAVAYSRVHTGVHYPGDVVAGALLGVVCGDLVSWISPRLRRR